MPWGGESVKMVFEKTLTAMVKGIRAHRGKETEYINVCVQEIQKEVVSKNLATKSMAVLKLAYLNMLGYDMSWATFAVVEVMSHSKFAIKRPGYLASAMTFTEHTDVGLLTINLFKKDFERKSQYETGLAITCLSSICTPQICRDIVTDLMAMLSSSRAYLRKKTVLCLYRVFLKEPPALRACFTKLKDRLGDEDQGVLTAAVNTFLELARKNARNYLSLVPKLYHILVNTTNNWLSIKLLKLFQLLCPLEPRLPAKMVEPLTNLLQTTKAQSVEFEVIRCTFRIMPDGTAITVVAMERLQAFLNSSDRNLRFLALEIFKEVLEKPHFKERFHLPDLHAKVLQSIEESDTTARKIALQLLDLIVTPSNFIDAVKKLMDFSKNTSPNDEFIGTILRIGARDRYSLVEDFAWYLLVLADISRNLDSCYSAMVADQFTDVSVRVAQVRPYAVALALSLLDRDPSMTSTAAHGGAADDAAASTAKDAAGGTAAPLEIAAPMVGACAWVIGEYYEAFENPVDLCFLKAARALLVSKHVQTLGPSVQTQCIWAAAKLYLGSPRYAPGVTHKLFEILVAQLPLFIKSTHVDVSERATLALHLATFFQEGDPASAFIGAALFTGPLLPVAPAAQQAVLVPEGLNLDAPFFPAEQIQQDDVGFLVAQDARQVQGGTAQQASSMFYLPCKETEPPSATTCDASGTSKSTASVPLDPLEQMRQRLAAAQAGGMKYEVLREEVRAPIGRMVAAITAPAAGASGSGAGAAELGIPPEKSLSDLSGRLWTLCYRDDHVGVYACVRAKNPRRQQLRIDLRCERILDTPGSDASPSVSDVAWQLPAGVIAQEADAMGFLVLASGALQERSAKVRCTLSRSPFLAPVAFGVAGNLQYSLILGESAPRRIAAALELRLPATTFLTPAPMTEDEVAEYVAENSAELLKEQTAQAVSLMASGKAAAALSQELPGLVGRCAGLCNFYGIQQQAATQNKSQKFLLVARPPPQGPSQLVGQEALPEAARVIVLCAGLPKDGMLDIRVTVKSCRKDVCDDISLHLVNVFRECMEGRLRDAVD